MNCPKCNSTDIDLCPICKHELKRCKTCGFVAEKKYFEGEPLPSKKEREEKVSKERLLESGLYGP